MRSEDKFFLWYCKALYYGVPADGRLKNKECRRIYNEFLGRDSVFFALLMTDKERINFLLFCAAEHGEL